MTAEAGIKECTLYVGDLHPSVTTATLYEVFSGFKPPSHCYVQIDSETQQSRRFGFVTYNTQDQALKALKLFNNKILFGKPMRVMLRNDDPTERQSGKGNLFVKNLPKTFTEEEFYEEFSKIGPILSVKISRNASGESKGFGYVQFEKEEDAVMCINVMNGQICEGKKLIICPYIPRKDRIVRKGPANVLVNNLRPQIDAEQLAGYFKSYGEILNTFIVRDECGNSMRYGFVQFKESKSAQAAVEGLNGAEFMSVKLVVSEEFCETVRGSDSSGSLSCETQRVLAWYQPEHITEEELKAAFADCRNLLSCKICNIGMSEKGLALLNFASKKDAMRAVLVKNGFSIGSSRIICALVYTRIRIPRFILPNSFF